MWLCFEAYFLTIEELTGTAFQIRSSKGIIIIDTGWDEKDADLIANSMIKLGLNPAEIKYILVTHGHQDHYGGTGTPDNFDMNYLYISSVKYFAEITAKYQVDIEMSGHAWVDNTFERILK